MAAFFPLYCHETYSKWYKLSSFQLLAEMGQRAFPVEIRVLDVRRARFRNRSQDRVRLRDRVRWYMAGRAHTKIETIQGARSTLISPIYSQHMVQRWIGPNHGLREASELRTLTQTEGLIISAVMNGSSDNFPGEVKRHKTLSTAGICKPADRSGQLYGWSICQNN